MCNRDNPRITPSSLSSLLTNDRQDNSMHFTRKRYLSLHAPMASISGNARSAMIALRNPPAGTVRAGAVPPLDSAELLVAYPVQRLYVPPAQVRPQSLLPREAFASGALSALPVSVLPIATLLLPAVVVVVVPPPSFVPPVARTGKEAVMAVVRGSIVISHCQATVSFLMQEGNGLDAVAGTGITF